MDGWLSRVEPRIPAALVIQHFVLVKGEWSERGSEESDGI